MISTPAPSRSPVIPLSIRLAVTAVLLLGHTARAATVNKANNTTNLDTAASWVGNTVPGTGDILLWDSTVTGANIVSLGSNKTFGQIQITNPGGAVTINSNTLTLNGVAGTGIDMSVATQNLTISSAVVLGGNQSWNVANSAALTVGGVTSGAFALSKDGAGILTLSGVNTYSLGTAINAGALTLSGSTATAGTGTITIGASGILNLAGQTVSNTIAGSGVINITTGSATFNGSASSLTGFTGTVNISSSAGSANKTVIGANTASGATFNVANGATLYLQGTGSSASAITLAGGGNSENLGALRVEGTLSGPVTLTGNATIGDLSSAGTISGAIGDGGNNYGFVKEGNQTLFLTNASTYSGATAVASGTLNLSGLGALTNTSSVAVLNGGALVIGDTSVSTNKINSLAGLTLGFGTVTLTKPTAGATTQTFSSLTIGGNGASTVNNANGTNTLTFTFAGGSGYERSAGGLVNFASGAGTMAFANALTFAGDSAVTNGVLGATNDILIGAVLTNGTGAGNNTDFVSASTGQAIAYTNDAFATGVNSNVTNTESTGATSTQSLRFSAANKTLTLTGTMAVESGGIILGPSTSTSTISGGVLTSGAGSNGEGSQDLWVFGNSGNNLVVNSAIADNMTAGTATGFEKYGANTVTLVGNNTFTGPVYIAGGFLKLASVNALGSGSANINFTQTSTLQGGITGLAIGRNIVVYSGQTATIDTNGADATFSGTLGNATNSVGSTTGFTKTGAGTLFFTGTTIGNPMMGLTLNSTGNLDITGNLVLNNNGASNLNGGTAPNSITVHGNGVFSTTTDFNLSQTSNGQIVINIQDNAFVSQSGRVFIGHTAGSLATINQSGGTFLAQSVFNVGAVGATIGFGGASNQGVGVYNLTGGTLKLASGSSAFLIDTGSALNLNGGLLLFTTGTTAVGSTNSGQTTQGQVVIQDNGALISVANGITTQITAPIAHGGVAAMDGGLTKMNSGQLTLSAANTYNGATIVNGGTLLLDYSLRAATGAVQSTPTANMINGASALVLGGGTLSVTGRSAATASTSIAGTAAAGDSRITAVAGSTANYVVGQSITGTGIAPGTTITAIFQSTTNTGVIYLSQAAAGAVTSFSTAAETAPVISQSFSGTTINAGASTITLSQNNAASVTLNLGAISRNTGGVLNFSAIPNTTTTIVTTTSANDASGILGSWATVGTGTNLQYAANNGSGQVVAYAGATAASSNLANVTSGTGNFTYATAATLAAPASANTLSYTGGASTTALNGNTLTVNGLMNAGTGALTISGAGSLAIGSAQELVIIGNTQSTTISSTIVDNIAGVSALTYSAASTGATLTLSGSNGYSGKTTIASGTVSVSNLASGGNLGTGVSSINLGGGAVTGVLSYTGASTTLTRGFTVGGGTGGGEVDVTAVGQTLTISTGNIDNSSGGLFTVGGAGNTIINSIVGGGSGGLTKTGAGVLTLNGANTFSGVTTISGGTVNVGVATVANTSGALGINSAIVFANATGNVLNLNGFNTQVGSLFSAGTGASGGAILLGNGTLTTGADFTNTTYAGTVSGAGGLTKIGAGTQILSGNNTYLGATTVSLGTLRAGASTAFSPVSAMNIVAGTLDLNGFGSGVGSLTGAGNVLLGSATLTTGGDNTRAAYSGQITGAGGLTKTGTGSQTFSGASLFTGAFNVTVGKVIVSGSIGGSTGVLGLTGVSSVNVSAGATLASGITGTIATAGNGNINVAGALAPGDLDSAGVLTLAVGTAGKLNFTAGSVLNFDLGATTSSSDQVVFNSVNDWLQGSGNVTLQLNGMGAGIDYGRTYTIFQNVSTAGFQFASVTGYDSADYTANIAQSGNSYQLSFAAVPEPGAAMSLFVGFGMLLMPRRRRRERHVDPK